MIVGTRMPDGKIAHFEVEGKTHEDVRNTIRTGLTEDGFFHEFMPFLVSIPGCGKNLKKSVVAHLIRPTGKDPLKGALDTINEAPARGVPTESQELPDGGLLYVRSGIDEMLETDE